MIVSTLWIFPSVYSVDVKSFFDSNLETGDGTYYKMGEIWKNPGKGACAFCNANSLSAFKKNARQGGYIAINTAQFGESVSCGMCLQYRLKGEAKATDGKDPPSKSWTKAIVVDHCPDAGCGLDIGADKDGRFNLEWQAIPCDTSSNLNYAFEGSNKWYAKLSVRNHKMPIKAVAVCNNGNDCKDLKRLPDNHWEGDKVSGKMNIRVTSITGEVVCDTLNVAFSGDEVTNTCKKSITGNAQFKETEVGGSGGKRACDFGGKGNSGESSGSAGSGSGSAGSGSAGSAGSGSGSGSAGSGSAGSGSAGSGSAGSGSGSGGTAEEEGGSGDSGGKNPPTDSGNAPANEGSSLSWLLYAAIAVVVVVLVILIAWCYLKKKKKKKPPAKPLSNMPKPPNKPTHARRTNNPGSRR